MKQKEYLPEDYILGNYMDHNNIRVKDILNKYPRVKGILKFKSDYKIDIEGKKIEVSRYLDFNNNESKARRFSITQIPIEIKRVKPIIALDLSVFFNTKPSIDILNSTPKKYYTYSEILEQLQNYKPISYLPLYGDISIDSLVKDLKYRYNHQDESGFTLEMQKKYAKNNTTDNSVIKRKYFTDICFIIYLLSDKKRFYFTDNMINKGICILDNYWNSLVIDFIKSK